MSKLQLSVALQIEDIPITAAYLNEGPNRQMLIGSVDFEGQGQLNELVPQSLRPITPDITVEEVFCMLPNTGGRAFGARLGMDFDLTDLPLVGKKMPPSLTIGINNLSVVFATDKLQLSKARTYTKGVNISADINMGSVKVPLAISSGGGNPAPATGTSTGAVAGTQNQGVGDGVTWIDLNKKAGPVTFQRLGFQYGDGALWLLLDGSLAVAGVTLALDGLGVGSPLQNFAPTFKLRGLSIAFRQGALSIMGALMRNQRKIGEDTVTTYDGVVLIKTAAFSLTALGSYAEYKGQASLFIYGVFLRPIGGPPFLFVTGITAGFGLNRGLKVPKAENTLKFPLVGVVMGTQKLDKDPFNLLQSLSDYIPPAIGQYFLTFGIKFTSFKLIDSFALVTVGFGNSYSLDVLGISRLTVPPKIGNSFVLAQVEMAIKVSYDFQEQALKVKAVLTDNSYVLSKQCKLTGGFAFYSWFAGDYAGDFVYTLGGYHPNFKVPAHYPQVPRAGLSWKVNNNLSIKGTMYYALCSSACMAGGSLEASWSSGSIGAWFTLKADFIIAWKPYFYEAAFFLDMGVKYTLKVNLGFLGKIKKTFKVSLGVKVSVWGPDFAGYAKINLSVISFKIKFGNQSRPNPDPLTWDDFKTSFLPPASQMLTMNVLDGLIKTREDEVMVVNPKEMVVTLNTAIPVSKVELSGFQGPKSFGIGMMGKQQVDATLKVSIIKNDEDVTEAFDIVGIYKNMPKALWDKAKKEGVYSKPEMDSELISGLLAGLSISPAPKEKPAVTQEKDLADFQYDVETKLNAYDWSDRLSTTESDQAVSDTITDEAVRAKRTSILQGLGIPETIDPINLTTAEGFSDAFLVEPQLLVTNEQ